MALHGSWNRTLKDGYKVVSLHFGDDDTIEERDFLTGFLEDEDVIGRPVDIAQGPDGAIYVSDDYANVIWRVSRTGQGPASPGTLGTSTDRPSDPLAGIDPATLTTLNAEGEVLYATHACADCHEAGTAVEGVVAKPLENLGARFTAEELAALLATPPSPMPIPDLTDPQRNALAVHLLMRDAAAPATKPE